MKIALCLIYVICFFAPLCSMKQSTEVRTHDLAQLHDTDSASDDETARELLSFWNNTLQKKPVHTNMPRAVYIKPNKKVGRPRKIDHNSHKGVKLINYVCTYKSCIGNNEHRFNNEDDFKQHYIEKHPKAPIKPTSYTCSLCDEETIFSSAQLILAHRKKVHNITDIQ